MSVAYIQKLEHISEVLLKDETICKIEIDIHFVK